MDEPVPIPGIPPKGKEMEKGKDDGPVPIPGIDPPSPPKN
jgi:hypothetical protein